MMKEKIMVLFIIITQVWGCKNPHYFFIKVVDISCVCVIIESSKGKQLEKEKEQ